MYTFIKLGGSLITDKRVERSFRRDVAERIAQEIASALIEQPDLRILIGHGSGSFGHFAAARHKTAQGVQTSEQWRAFAEVATVAAELSGLVAQVLQDAGVPVWRISPSASAISRDGEIATLSLSSITTALEHALVPLVHGDVSIDEMRGGTIVSTERVFFYLAHHLPVNRILLLGEVSGVYDAEHSTIPEITPANYSDIEQLLGGSGGIDVTGGMETKVRDMLDLTLALPHLNIRIMDGRQPDLLRQTLLGNATPGTRIHNPV